MSYYLFCCLLLYHHDDILIKKEGGNMEKKITLFHGSEKCSCTVRKQATENKR